MYQPKAFAPRDLASMHDLVEAEAFGALVVVRPDATPEIAHIPFLLDRELGAAGVLRGHVARANPIWRELADGRPATVIFQGPHAYVSPQWYRSRREVPTWNYAVVHARCTPRVMDDREELRRLLVAMAARFEEGDAMWTLADPDARELEEMLGEIVGFELEIRELEGKFKLSQNRAEPDRVRVREALRRRGRRADLELAALMDGA